MLVLVVVCCCRGVAVLRCCRKVVCYSLVVTGGGLALNRVIVVAIGAMATSMSPSVLPRTGAMASLLSRGLYRVATTAGQQLNLSGRIRTSCFAPTSRWSPIPPYLGLGTAGLLQLRVHAPTYNNNITIRYTTVVVVCSCLLFSCCSFFGLLKFVDVCCCCPVACCKCVVAVVLLLLFGLAFFSDTGRLHY